MGMAKFFIFICVVDWEKSRKSEIKEEKVAGHETEMKENKLL
jgi:hypothetical protein